MEYFDLFYIVTVGLLTGLVWYALRTLGKAVDALGEMHNVKERAHHETLSRTISQLVGSLKAASPEEAVAASVGAAHDHNVLEWAHQPAPEDVEKPPIEAELEKRKKNIYVEGLGEIDLLHYNEEDFDKPVED